MFVVEHDNGKRGQNGYTEYQVVSWKEINWIIESLEKEGIVVYSVYKAD